MGNDPVNRTQGHRERLKSRFLTNSASFEDIQLLELLLTYSIPRKDVAPIAQKLVEKFTDVSGVFAASTEELLAVEGIGESALILILLVQRFRLLERKMSAPNPDAVQLPLFNSINDEQSIDQSIKIYTNDEIANALRFIPMAVQFQDLESYKEFLLNQLPYNAESTRRRRMNYLIDRFFPDGRIDTDLTLFLKNCSSQDCIKPILFYHILKTEPLIARVAEDFVWSALPVGYIERESLRSFVLQVSPDVGASSQKNILRSILTTYDQLGLGKLQGSTLQVDLHAGSTEAFLYILASEYPGPGTFSFQQLEQGVMHRSMLWHRDWMRQQLYMLRDLGVIAKISEIDNVRQFTLEVGSTDTINQFFSRDK